MYPSDEQPYGGQPASNNKVAWVIVGLLVAVLVGIICGAIGFWLGSKWSSNQNSPANVNALTPTPTPVMSPTPTATPTPTPTPEIAGKYAGPTGDVEISDVTEKSFSFSIGVGNSGGSGEIDGKAVRNTPSVATFSQIPDETLYNDPDSIYYKKKCKLTFRIAGGKVKVSEDDYACSYWHGAQVDFNGTFATVKKK